MLPLEGIFFVPSLIVAPVVLLAFAIVRTRRDDYHRWWYVATSVCVVLCMLFALWVWQTPLYSQQNHSPQNPGGFSSSPISVIGVFLLVSCLVIPAFPVLLGLAWLSPRQWTKRVRMSVLGFLCVYLIVLIAGILGKHNAFVSDYRSFQQRRLQQQDQFEHVRRP